MYLGKPMRILPLLLLPSLALSGCQRDNAANKSETTTAATQQALVQATVQLTLSRPSAWSVEDFVIVGRERVSISDRAKIFGVNTSVASLGSEPMQIGYGASTPNLWAANGLSLANTATVSGAIESGTTPQIGVGVSVAGPTLVRSGAPTLSNEVVTVEFPDCSENLYLEPGRVRELGPQSGGDVVVKRGAELWLHPGTYYIASLSVEPGGVVKLLADGRPYDIRIRNSATLRGSVTTTNKSSVLGLLVAGADVVIDTPIAATVIAPNARVAVNSTCTVFEGSIYARDVYVAPDVVVKHSYSPESAYSVTEPEAPSLAELNLPTTAGPAPSLVDPSLSPGQRASNFVSWLLGAKAGDLEAAASAVDNVRSVPEIRGAFTNEVLAALDSKDLDRALAALDIVTELDTDDSEALFVSLIDRLPPGTGEWDSQRGAPVDDLLLERVQAKAVLGLGWRRSGSAKSKLKTTALQHASRLVRIQAIRMYKLYWGQDGANELAALLPAELAKQLDVYESVKSNGQTYAEKEAEFSVKHPEIPIVTVPSPAPTYSNTCFDHN